jgi:[ribosomal protein S18]-alanine N-acetyltransferase
MIIRVATEADLPALTKLEALCNPSPWSYKQLADALTLSAPISIIEKQHTVIAMLVWQALIDQAEIHLLNTHPLHRRQGYAKKLLNHLYLSAQQQNMQRILLEVRAGNDIAQQLYLQNGFTNCGKRKNYYSNGEDAVLMEKTC